MHEHMYSLTERRYINASQARLWSMLAQIANVIDDHRTDIAVSTKDLIKELDDLLL